VEVVGLEVLLAVVVVMGSAVVAIVVEVEVGSAAVVIVEEDPLAVVVKECPTQEKEGARLWLAPKNSETSRLVCWGKWAALSSMEQPP
jgi:hypothetical protein